MLAVAAGIHYDIQPLERLMSLTAVFSFLYVLADVVAREAESNFGSASKVLRPPGRTAYSRLEDYGMAKMTWTMSS